MYEKISIKRYRQFENLEVEGFSRINIFTGRNNSGKTSILEAITLHSNAYNPLILSTLRSYRESKNSSDVESYSSEKWKNYFPKLDTSNKIEIEGTYDNETWEVKIEYLDDRTQILNRMEESEKDTSLIKANDGEITALILENISDSREEFISVIGEDGKPLFIDSREPKIECPFKDSMNRQITEYEIEEFSKLEKNKNKDLLIEALKEIDKRIEDLVLIDEDGNKEIYADIGEDKLIGISQLGGGVIEATETILGIFMSKNNIVIFDEIANGIHQSAFKGYWEAIDKVAEESNVQIFASTHSYDCLEGLRDSSLSNYSVYRLEKNKKRDLVKYDNEELDSALKSNFEVR